MLRFVARRLLQMVPVLFVIATLTFSYSDYLGRLLKGDLDLSFKYSNRTVGLIVTKLDGSGKGGIVVAIQDELGIPTRFVGTGEKIDNLAQFDGREFVAKML